MGQDYLFRGKKNLLWIEGQESGIKNISGIWESTIGLFKLILNNEMLKKARMMRATKNLSVE